MVDRRNEIGDRLFVKGLVTQAQLDHALFLQQESYRPIGDILLDLGYVSRSELNLQARSLMQESLLNVLQPMFDLELVISDFYYLCGERYPAEADFWTQMGNDEVRHCLFIGQIIEALYKSPHLFDPFQPFSPQVVTRLITAVQKAHHRIKNEQLSLTDALGYAYDFEIGMLENRLFDLLTTRDEEAQKLIDIIRSETQLHRQQIIDAAGQTPKL